MKTNPPGGDTVKPTRVDLISAIQGLRSALEQQIDTVSIDLNLLQADFCKVLEKVGTAETNIGSLQEDMASLKKQMTTVCTEVDEFGSWRFPSEILQEPVGKDTLTQLLTEYMEHNWQSTHSRTTEWEACKMVLPGGCMGFTCGVRKTLQAEMTDREDVLAAFQRGVGQRLNAQGEEANLLRQLIERNPRGGEATTQHDIVAVFRDHLEGLYENPGDPDLDGLGEYLMEVCLPQLSELGVEALEADITLDEVMEAIKSLPLGRSPGSDGFTEGLIAMIPKSETATSDPAAYSLITMINLDVKVLAKLLAVRLATEVGAVRVEQTPVQCLLGDVKRKKGKEMRWQFVQLAPVLAKQRVAITWMGARGPDVRRLRTYVKEWVLAEEICLKRARRDEHLEGDMRAWQEMIESIAELEDTGQEDSLSTQE
ncbi:hypothetical protein NDU88_006060 [Pleurodeles waltl]|uniref:Uncharacterized protein n=1 Tax=Pleurodeles waltl TaxID=8319 RepID=A0AAV7NS60_PLEWA|nr:hypothetical protein NDU88_006060 [Pleurodeles waltl]